MTTIVPTNFPSPLLGTEQIRAFGTSSGTIQSAGEDFYLTTAQIAALASKGGTPVAVNGNLTTVGAGTLTAALLVGRVITRSGPTAAFTDTTDTAANIIAALPSLAVIGESFYIDYINTTAFVATLAAGTNVTLSGIATVLPANSITRMLLTYATASTVTLQVVETAYNAAGGYDPSTVSTQFGSGTSTFLEEGNIYKNIPATAINPGSTGNDNVLAVFSVPANSFDGVSNRGLAITACGSVANNTNAKRMKIIFNATTAVVGSAVTGGTTIADTGSYTTTGAAGWQINAQVFKYGAAGSNTQLCLHESTQIGSTVSSLVSPQQTTATESGAILIAITGNATTTATDIALNFVQINAMN